MTLGDMLGDEILNCLAEFHFIAGAIAYERGEQSLLTDDQWDRLGYALQAHPERWTPWFRKRVNWTPGRIEKPTIIAINMDIAQERRHDQSRQPERPPDGQRDHA